MRDRTLFAKHLILALLATIAGCRQSVQPHPSLPRGYPESYAGIIARARGEAALNIWSATDHRQVRELIADFVRSYPGIDVRYRDMPASLLHERFLADARGSRNSADLLWSPAMDLQIKLVNDGYAQSYASPEKAQLPGWANWKNQAWGVTAEPIAMVYNRRLLAPGDAPASHLELQRLLEARPPALAGKVATYDPAASAAGYLYLSQDDLASRDIWRLVRGLSANRVRLFTTTEAIIADVAAGKSVIGYNVAGSYAFEKQRQNPDLAVVLPRDYTLLMSRIAMIPARAPHPNAARLFLDFLLSKRGQRHLVAHSMPSVRGDVAMPASLRAPGARARAIKVGPALLVVQDRLTRRRFMKRWRRALDDGSAAAPVSST